MFRLLWLLLELREYFWTQSFMSVYLTLVPDRSNTDLILIFKYALYSMFILECLLLTKAGSGYLVSVVLVITSHLKAGYV